MRPHFRWDFARAVMRALFREPLSGDSPRLIEVENLETQVIRMEVHHGSFSLPVLLAVKFDGFDVLDRKSGREVGVAERSVGYEDAFAVGHSCAHVAP